MGDLATLNLAQADPRERTFTVVGDREQTVVIAFYAGAVALLGAALWLVQSDKPNKPQFG